MQFHFENNAFICKCCSFLSVIRNRILCCDPHPKRQLTSQTFELVSLEILLALNIVGWILQNRIYRGFVALLNICARSELHAFKSFIIFLLFFRQQNKNHKHSSIRLDDAITTLQVERITGN